MFVIEKIRYGLTESKRSFVTATLKTLMHRGAFGTSRTPSPTKRTQKGYITMDEMNVSSNFIYDFIVNLSEGKIDNNILELIVMDREQTIEEFNKFKNKEDSSKRAIFLLRISIYCVILLINSKG